MYDIVIGIEKFLQPFMGWLTAVAIRCLKLVIFLLALAKSSHLRKQPCRPHTCNSLHTHCAWAVTASA